MKKIYTAILILTLCAGSLFSAPRVKIVVQNVTPYFLKMNPVLAPDSCNTTGMNIVPKGTFVYLAAMNFGDTTSITSATYTFISKPAGSGATITTIPSLNWVKFKADSTGTYTINLHAVTNSGSKDTTLNIYTSTFVGVGNFNGIPGAFPKCMSCHGSTPSFVDIFNRWKVGGHANRFRYQIDSATSYSTSCMKCHTTGYDHNNFASNGGFDDVARSLGWVWTSPPHPGKWDSLKTVYPSLVNLATIGCESCHGPGSEHYLAGGDTNKISLSINSGKCAKCHDSPPNHNVYNQWKNTIHAHPVMEGRVVADAQRNTFSDCNRCHDGEMYVGFTYGRKLPVNLTTADQEVIGCASCHDPHSNSNDYSVRNRVTGSDTLSGGIHYPSTVNTAIVCLDCHKARRYNVWYVQSRVTSSTWGPHESPQGDIVLGKNAATFNNIPYVSGSHANIEGLCVTCHMAATTDTGTVTRDKVGGHTWNLHYDATNYDHVTGCQGCHPGVTKFDDFMSPSDFDGNGLIESWQKEIRGCLSNLGHALPHTGYDTVSWQLIAADSNNVNLRKAYWNYQLVKNDKSLGLHNPFYVVNVLLASISNTVGVQNIGVDLPKKFELAQNYPNPFNPTTKINFSIPKATFVTLKVYDITGREMTTLVNQKMTPGNYSATWFAQGNGGTAIASGVYFYRLITSEFVSTKKMVLVK